MVIGMLQFGVALGVLGLVQGYLVFKMARQVRLSRPAKAVPPPPAIAAPSAPEPRAKSKGFGVGSPRTPAKGFGVRPPLGTPATAQKQTTAAPRS